MQTPSGGAGAGTSTSPLVTLPVLTPEELEARRRAMTYGEWMTALDPAPSPTMYAQELLDEESFEIKVPGAKWTPPRNAMSVTPPFVGPMDQVERVVDLRVTLKTFGNAKHAMDAARTAQSLVRASWPDARMQVYGGMNTGYIDVPALDRWDTE